MLRAIVVPRGTSVLAGGYAAPDAEEYGTWSYDQVTMLKLDALAEPFAHVDRNTLRRAG